MSAEIRLPVPASDAAAVLRDAPRILSALAETGAVLAVAADMDRAVVLRSGTDGRMLQTAMTGRQTAQALALKEWITCIRTGRVASYALAPAGRIALKRMADQATARRRGLAEDATPFKAFSRDWDAYDDDESARPVRYGTMESPVVVLARRRDRDGRPFLEPELVVAAERLREDFELARMGAKIAQNWEVYLTSQDDFIAPEGNRSPRDRVARALRDLGPGLGDMVLRCCCYLEGLEVAEQKMGWAARSGKIVLRIALQRLHRHYDETYGKAGPLIG